MTCSGIVIEPDGKIIYIWCGNRFIRVSANHASKACEEFANTNLELVITDTSVDISQKQQAVTVIMKIIKMLMFQIKISLVVMPIMPHLLTPWQTTPRDISTSTTQTMFQQKIVKSVTVLHRTENTHKLLFFLAGKANGKKGWFNVQNSNDR